MFHHEIVAGRVTTVLREYELEPLPIHLIYPSRRLVPAKVRVVSDFLADELQTEPALAGGSVKTAPALIFRSFLQRPLWLDGVNPRTAPGMSAIGA